jgi:hypothetical protein
MYIRMAIVIAAAWTLTGLAASGTQKIPDFSGTWVRVYSTDPDITYKPATDSTAGPALNITQTATSLTSSLGSAEKTTYALDGSKTKRDEKQGNTLRTIVATARWSSPKLIITEEYGLSKREITYQLDAANGQLIVVRNTTLLYSKGGALTVSTIGPVTIVYRKG